MGGGEHRLITDQAQGLRWKCKYHLGQQAWLVKEVQGASLAGKEFQTRLSDAHAEAELSPPDRWRRTSFPETGPTAELCGTPTLT